MLPNSNEDDLPCGHPELFLPSPIQFVGVFCFILFCFKFSLRLGVMKKLDYIWVSQALTDDFSKIAILKEVDNTDGNKNS